MDDYAPGAPRRGSGPDLQVLADRARILDEHDALVPGGDALRWARQAAAEEFRNWWTEELTIQEASRWSGYSPDHLREMVRSGRLPDRRKEARRGIPVVIRRCDLPRKAVHERPGGPRAPRKGDDG